MKRVCRRNKGFTLLELLIVVAIIGTLVAVSIPFFMNQMHKARVATDWANLRNYYSELHADYVSTGEYNSKVPVDWHTNPTYDWNSITFLDGTKVQLRAGTCAVSFAEGTGYSIAYQCSNWDTRCALSINVTEQ